MSEQERGAALARLTLAYAPAGERAMSESLLAFDARLAGVVRGAREPLIAQLKLAWWRDRLTALGEEKGRGEPLLAGLAELVEAGRVEMGALQTVVDAWEQRLVQPPASELEWREFGDGRGRLFAAFPATNEAVESLGRAWALWDAGLAEADSAQAALAWSAGRAVELGRPAPHPRAARPVVALGLFAAGELARSTEPRMPAGAGAFLRLLRHGLTGR